MFSLSSRAPFHSRWLTAFAAIATIATNTFTAAALERPGVEFKIFQFPPDRIPRVDGDASDWDIVPESYTIGSDQLKDTVHNSKPDPKNLNVQVKVGWVKGLNQLWFLYQAEDNFWDFERRDLRNDIFELVVDGDLSAGPLILNMNPEWDKQPDGYQKFQGNHAQNYHIFTPPKNKEWAMVWGGQVWIKDLPYANAAYRHSLQHGQSGKLTLEFWITPFDFAPSDGPARAQISQLRENRHIGLSWSILDYDDGVSDRFQAFWNLSHKTTMYGDASDLCRFRLMPLEPKFVPELKAFWNHVVVSPERGVVAFEDRSIGPVQRWRWDFGDGETATDQHPIHTYKKGGEYTVVLEVDGPKGKASHSKVWDVTLPKR